ncbi:MAG TPA: 2'-5' RNA ligase family protein [Candidatus Saccharimonadales bacterium]|jgi:2'-5' RNA ligase
MLSGDRLICAFVEPQAVGTQFKTWLLHVTIVPWFRLDESSEVLAEGLKRAMYGLEPFDVTTGNEAQFGPHRNRPVRLLAPTEQLERVEAKVRGYLHKKRAFLIDETTRKPYNFRPHVTAQSGFLLPRNAKLHIGRLYIVEQKGDYKETVSEVRLYDQTAA